MHKPPSHLCYNETVVGPTTNHSFIAKQSAVLKDNFNYSRTTAHRLLVTKSELKICRRAKLTIAGSNSLAQNHFTSLHIKIALFTRAKNFRVP